MNSIVEKLRAAIELHRGGDLDGAERAYEKILADSPDQPDTLHFMGVLRAQRGDWEDGVGLIRRSIEHNPDHPDAHNNLGNILREGGRTAEAIEAYEACLRLQPNSATTLLNLGHLLLAEDRVEEALDSYTRAVDLRPDHAPSNLGLGRALCGSGRHEEALEPLRRAEADVSLEPTVSLHIGRALLKTRKLPEAIAAFQKGIEARPEAAGPIYRDLGMIYTSLDRIEEAVEVYSSWCRVEPDNPIAEHLHAAARGQTPPKRASEGYIAKVFDDFADTFDERLEGLGYRAPMWVCDTLTDMLPDTADDLCIVDAGCGTGLCGPLLRETAARLVGVDLSENMVEHARARGVYDDLAVADLTRYFTRHEQSADAVASADTLCYFGELDEVLSAMAAALRDGGCFAFTVERAEPEREEGDWALRPHGRYAHSPSYLDRALADAGLQMDRRLPVVIRSEGGEEVHGFVVAGRKSD